MKIRQRWVVILIVILLSGLVIVAIKPLVRLCTPEITFHFDKKFELALFQIVPDMKLNLWLEMRAFGLREYNKSLATLEDIPHEIDEELRRISASETEVLGRRVLADAILWRQTRQQVHLENLYAKVRKGEIGRASCWERV